MPPQKRRWRDQELGPLKARQQSTGRRQEPSVSRPKRRSMDLTTQDPQLMPEHDDLKLFRVRRSKQKREQLQDPLEGNANDRQEHGFSPTENAAILPRSN
jgi:hypothetical protein